MANLRVVKGGEALGMGLADYIWVNEKGTTTFKKKTILIAKDAKGDPVPLIDRWTSARCACDVDHQEFSEQCTQPVTVLLAPCFYLPDPTRPQPNYLVLCETRDQHDKAEVGNYRSLLRKALRQRGPKSKLIWFGFEQDYILADTGDDTHNNPSGREFLTAERHFGACFDAGLLIHSMWNDILARTGTWEFKVGFRRFPQDLDPDPPSALTVCDHLVVAQYLMEKIGAEKGLAPEWRNLNAFVSTPELREAGRNNLAELDKLVTLVEGEGLKPIRAVPDSVNGGFLCLEVTDGYQQHNPYSFALRILEAVWPLENKGSPDSSEDEEEDAG